MRVLLIHAKDLRLTDPAGALERSRQRAEPGRGMHNPSQETAPADRFLTVLPSGGMGAGGISIHLAQLVEALPERGWSISMVRFCPEPNASADHAANFYELKSSGNRIRPGVRRDLRRIVRAVNPDVIHLHSVDYALDPWMISELRKVKPVVYTFHDVTSICYWQTKLHPDGRLCTVRVGIGCMTGGCYRLGAHAGLVRDVARVSLYPFRLAAYRRLPVITVPSRYLKEQLIVNGFSPRCVQVVPGFSRFVGLGSVGVRDQEAGRILFVGRLCREKGILAFVQALSLLQADHWEAVVVGDGPLLSEAVHEVAAHGLSRRVTFAGAVNADVLRGHYETCSFLAMPSLIPESFGMVGVEAMSFGKPVVAFGAGGIHEWLEDKVNGLMVEHGDVKQFAGKLDLLLKDGPLRRRLGSAGFAAVKARFGVDHHADRLVELYEALILERGGN